MTPLLEGDDDMEQRISSEELQNTARFVEKTNLGALADFSDISFPPVSGDLKEFPSLAPEDHAAERGIEVLRRNTEDAVATLNALAAALDNGFTIPPTLLEPVQPFIDAYRKAEEPDTSENSHT